MRDSISAELEDDIKLKHDELNIYSDNSSYWLIGSLFMETDDACNAKICTLVFARPKFLAELPFCC